MRTVILRLFEPAAGCVPVELSGVVEDVSTQCRATFSGVAELIEALHQVAESRAHPGWSTGAGEGR